MNKTTSDKYSKIKSEFQFHTDNLNAAKRNWQMIAFLLGVTLLISIISNIYTINRSHVVPYIVHVDDLGRALAVTAAKETTFADEKIIKAFAYQYIDMARSVVSDPETLKKNLSLVYLESTKSVQSNFLDGYYKENNPFDYGQKIGTRHIEPIIFLKESENTYSMEWREIERNYDNQVLSESHYKALVSIVQVPYTKEDKYKENPLNPFGFYVTQLSWSKLN